MAEHPSHGHLGEGLSAVGGDPVRATKSFPQLIANRVGSERAVGFRGAGVAGDAKCKAGRPRRPPAHPRSSGPRLRPPCLQAGVGADLWHTMLELSVRRSVSERGEGVRAVKEVAALDAADPVRNQAPARVGSNAALPSVGDTRTPPSDRQPQDHCCRAPGPTSACRHAITLARRPGSAGHSSRPRPPRRRRAWAGSGGRTGADSWSVPR
jgi:hypothetical protein